VPGAGADVPRGPWFSQVPLLRYSQRPRHACRKAHKGAAHAVSFTSRMKGSVAMYPEQIFCLLVLIAAGLAIAFVVGSVRSYWRKLRVGPRFAPDDAPNPTRADVVLVAGLAGRSVGRSR
jgi:hypothetical protein